MNRTYRIPKKRERPRRKRPELFSHLPKRKKGSRRISAIGKHWRRKPAVVIRRDGKEVCNLAVPQGQAEYKWRVLLMWVRQGGLCCDCLEPMSLSEATFEHEDGRGAGRRDDRISIEDEEGRFIKHLNGAAHGYCNRLRGSTRAPIYHGNNAHFEQRGTAQ